MLFVLLSKICFYTYAVVFILHSNKNSDQLKYQYEFVPIQMMVGVY